jgi:phenylacetate-coenzyme A ligase PaaK-like adenylate-forming protein
MTFIPTLNFFEFVPEDEVLRYQMDTSYRPRTVLLDEVRPGERYEVVITNFHGGSLVRYRPGDMVKITSLANEPLGIRLPQMEFDQRVDGTIDFNVIRLSEKSIWTALEELGLPYEEWIAYKAPGNQSLSLFIELKDGRTADERALGEAVCRILTRNEEAGAGEDDPLVEDTRNMVGFSVNVTLLAYGTFSRYTASRQAEGADLAHLKPPHVNPSEKVLTTLLADARTAAGTSPADERVGV